MATYLARARRIVESAFDKNFESGDRNKILDVLADEVPEELLEGKTPSEKRDIIAEHFVSTVRNDIRSRFVAARVRDAVKATEQTTRQDAETEIGDIERPVPELRLSDDG